MRPQVGEIHTLEITGLSHEGAGVGRIEGLAVFIPGALPGETVRIKLTKVKSKFGQGEIVQIIQTSPLRSQPNCSSYDACGGCQLQHLIYEQQLIEKAKRVRDALQRIGKLDSFILKPTLGMEEPWYYRNKAQLHVGLVDGRIRLGYFRPGSHDLIPIEQCKLLPEEFMEVIKYLEDLFVKAGLKVTYGIDDKNNLKHVIIKRSFATGKMMIILVTSNEAFPLGKKLAEQLLMDMKNVVTVVHNINKNDKRILGDKFILLGGEEQLEENLCGLKIKLSPAAFLQVNPRQTEVLYRKVLDYAALKGKEAVFDLYCGVGVLSLLLAQQGKGVYAIEEIEEAIEDAKENALLNGIANVEFLAGKVEEVLPMLKDKGINPNVIVLDPPRQGCDKTVLETAAVLKPEQIIYVSCDPGTLARDLGLLDKLGYSTKEVQPVDMFPQTGHVECVVLMSRSEK
ncbi:23S rRNA (uracil(1939)-C(5))-methyltransferase RlmD [Bacillota bacterium LX-D]|nr:23S rRNA (uracil(1939)-C(5))-methyltransferase RlmD [Bacillota bacterium LX-D]